MINEGRRIADIRTGRQKGRVIESDRKRKLLAQNFQKAGILFIRENPPASQQGRKCLKTFLKKYR